MTWADFSIFVNPIACAIVATAVALYTLLLKFCFLLPRDEAWARQVRTSSTSFKVATGALPLMGLLGTIDGLMTTFGAISSNAVADLETLMAAGISDAMLTTQLGLSFAVPALALNAILNHRYRRYATAA